MEQALQTTTEPLFKMMFIIIGLILVSGAFTVFMAYKGWLPSGLAKPLFSILCAIGVFGAWYVQFSPVTI